MTFHDFILQNETPIRLGFFFGVFAIMGLWEVLAPRRALTVSKAVRWVNNLGLVFLNSAILRLIFPMAAVGVAAFAAEQGWGLLNYFQLPFAFSVLLAIVALDFIIYLQHVLVHAVPALWRLHRVHHADLDYDVTTGARFHTLEIILSMLIKFATILVLGPPVVAVIIFEVVLNAMAMFNHSNVSLPSRLDRIVRLFVVTPDMHRVHHSVEDNEANSNFGFNLSIWDRLFGTYIAQPREGHENMTIGIHGYRDPQQVNQLPGMLTLPFVGKITGYAINRREWSKPDEKH
ncbi:Fatty acid hydroxylase family (carotene hydroxylase/sterol desaturase) [hydrothermal vent metagenome]|uniref:Fatty acid hydroxylase family (Carotene hydroxylase/sterol desaturase) n=1 Tax=hydrothermal vent metagenome TaxID=652676 RepID=A0A3B1AD91_9ZZZZ